jgi:hypothetical protein
MLTSNSIVPCQFIAMAKEMFSVSNWNVQRSLFLIVKVFVEFFVPEHELYLWYL